MDVELEDKPFMKPLDEQLAEALTRLSRAMKIIETLELKVADLEKSSKHLFMIYDRMEKRVMSIDTRVRDMESVVRIVQRSESEEPR